MILVYPINTLLVNKPSYLILLISLVSSTIICLIFANKLLNKLLAPFTKLNHLKLLFKKSH
jgi:hypothetical protein